jgi:gliding motility-associated-like protein
MRLAFILIFLLSNLLITYRSLSQICNNNFSSHLYKSTSYDTFTHILATPANETIAVGNTISGYGFIARFSKKGNPLYSYQYIPFYNNNRVYFKNLRFTDVIQMKDHSTLVSGKILQEKYLPAYYANNIGVLMKLDDYGNIIWSRKFESLNGAFNSGFNLSISNIIETRDGDIVLYLAADYGQYYYSFGKIVCLTSLGVIKWSTLLASGAYDGSVLGLNAKRALFQAKDKSIIVGDVIYQANRLQNPSNLSDAQVHFFSLNPVTGLFNWETNYQIPLPDPLAITNMNDVSELTDGHFVFMTSLSTAGSAQVNPGVKATRITTDNLGNIYNILTYQLPGSTSTLLVSVLPVNTPDNKTYLLKGNNLGMLVKVNNSGAVVWHQGYQIPNLQFHVNCSASLQHGYAMLVSSFNSNYYRLLLTDSAGQISCANAPGELLMDSIVLNHDHHIITDVSVLDQNRFFVSDFPMNRLADPLETSIECQESSNCCTDFIDSTNIPDINICEGKTYHLPDGQNVKDSGTYFARFTTTLGCDSIRFYHLHVNKNPVNLSLGKDLCLEGMDTLELHASGGYTSYKWLNNPPVPDSSFIVNRAGTYWVSVSNSCGSFTDSVTVFSKCDFPIYLPNAFTPNKDGLNDEFKLLPGNKNNFVSLTIFNRWGQIVFQSNDRNKGWNGTFNKQPLATDIFVYFLIMKGLSGNSISKKGTVLLI